MKLTLEQQYKLFILRSTMDADALETLGASASAGMVFIPKAGIFRLQHQKS